MLEPATREDTSTRRLVLGFDGGCVACSDLAERISEQVGDRLEACSLHHPQVEHCREQALGEHAPWAPTLLEVGGLREIRAWTGPRMVVRLARALGPVSTWRLMQALGEIDAPKVAIVGSPVSDGGAAGMSRGQFLKGLGGAALASESHGGRRTLALGLLALLIFFANRLSAPGWVFVVLIAALVALVGWTLSSLRKEGRGLRSKERCSRVEHTPESSCS